MNEDNYDEAISGRRFMTNNDKLKQLIQKLAFPYWTPHPTSAYLTVWQPHIATFNMYYVLRGKPRKHNAGDIAKHRDYWQLAKQVCAMVTQQGPIGETVVVTTPPEFWEQVVQAKAISFERLLPLKEWQRVLNAVDYDTSPAQLRSHAGMDGEADKQ